MYAAFVVEHGIEGLERSLAAEYVASVPAQRTGIAVEPGLCATSAFKAWVISYRQGPLCDLFTVQDSDQSFRRNDSVKPKIGLQCVQTRKESVWRGLLVETYDYTVRLMPSLASSPNKRSSLAPFRGI